MQIPFIQGFQVNTPLVSNSQTPTTNKCVVVSKPVVNTALKVRKQMPPLKVPFGAMLRKELSFHGIPVNRCGRAVEK